jgi:type VI secretion system protein ImpA
MLTPELVHTLLLPIREDAPAGDDLEYDPAFTALLSAAEGKPEQQFGDTVIPAVEPDWRQVGEQAQALLRRSKDMRTAVLLLRASTRLAGINGFDAGLALLHGLLVRYWPTIHPQLDADDDNDNDLTMRLNALAPLTDEGMVLRDLYDARIGDSRASGPVMVRTLLAAYGTLPAPANVPGASVAHIQGALQHILADHPQALQAMSDLRGLVGQLEALLKEHTGGEAGLDLSKLRATVGVLYKAAAAAGSPATDGAEPDGTAVEPTESTRHASPPTAAGTGEIRSRDEALQMLDRVIDYLTKTEPGNPAPLLIGRAKQLIGVSFLDIMANLAPNALDTIETVTGRRPTAD